MWLNVAQRFRNIARATPQVSRGRRRIPHDERPAGPKLVRGRGWKRRRPMRVSAVRFLFHVVVAAAIFVLLALLARAALA